MEREQSPNYAVEDMKVADIKAVTAMRLQSWLDTYVNDGAGVTREWIEARNREQQSLERHNSRQERFLEGKEKGTFNGWVARNQNNEIIGSTTPFIDDDGVRHLGSLYVAKEWHGTGVSKALMQRAMDWLGDEHDVVLDVVSYNDRARAFYRKWGFEDIPGSETLFDGVIPELKMIRKGGKV